MRIFNIPASAPFLRTLIGALVDGRLIDGFEARQNPERLGDATLFLPTRRACRMARDMFLEVLQSEAVLLPRIVAIGDIDEDELAFATATQADALDLPPPLEPLRRRLILATLIGRWVETFGSKDPDDPTLVVAGPVSALSLADSLAHLMDDVATRQVPWDALDNLVPLDMDEHWKLTLGFIKFISQQWPGILDDMRAMEPVARRDRLIAAEAERLKRHAKGPVIAAGSTGSMPATAKFLDSIARLPQGAVVLPGLDTDLDDDSWAAIARACDGDARFSTQAAPTHPQFAMQALLARFNVSRAEVVTLAKAHGREVLLSEAMRPAPTTSQWRARLTEPDIAKAIAHGMTNVSVVEAVNAEEEALAIAVALRETAETDGKSAALVTPDRALARRVLAACHRWNLPVDDSGGDALMETQAGIFARLAAETALEGLAPATLLALLKHPLLRLGRDAGGFAHDIETIELALLRGLRPAPGCGGLKRAFEAFAGDMQRLRRGEPSGIHRGEPRAVLNDAEISSARALIDALCHALAPLDDVPPRGQHAFTDLAARHREVIARLGIDSSGAMPAFAEGDGTALAAAFDDIDAQGPVAGLSLPRGDYVELLVAAMADRTVRRAGTAGLRLRIYGPLEARLTQCDRVILGGLIEGVWPPQPRTDPWLNRPMRAQLGLDLPERRIGLSAHDFAQLMGAADVILTRAAKSGGAPSVASRFLHRLEAVAGDDAWQAAIGKGRRYLDLARTLDKPADYTPAAKPAPRPPLHLRPSSLSVTEIEHWLRDPYTIYARHILKLAQLEPVAARIGAADRGSAIHGAIADYAMRFADTPPADPLGELIQSGRTLFAPFIDEPEARALWWPRFERIARWFVEWDVARRQNAAHLFAEISGRIEIDAGTRKFTLRSRADRIEQLRDGRYAILDFKTGVVPTAKQVVIGLSPQLTLEAAILRAGGFDAVPAGVSVASLAYVKLSGGEPAGKETPLDLKSGDNDLPPDAAADDARRKLEDLVRAFEDENRAYEPLVLSMWKTRYGAYDDLARVKEWSATGGAGADA